MMQKAEFTAPMPSLLDIVRWRASRFLAKKRVNQNPLRVISHEKLEPNSVIWLGHASLWIDINNTKILIDPLLGKIPFYKRHTKLPIDKDKIVADIILITHAHYDHFDMPSIKFLIKQNPTVKIIAPIGFKRYLGKYSSNLTLLEWWQNIMIEDISITFVPSLHWSNRIMTDINKALWGGFAISSKEYSLYHSGDSAYGEHFGEIGDRFDIADAFLPIGAYKPEYIMKQHHIDPQEALRVCEELGAKRLIPIHYGTFELADEGLCEPLEWFEELLLERKYPFATSVANIGEVIYLTNISTVKST
jgi:L-ascorbate metabolism protein UlaG (beta-lactamase superfamily)